MSMNVYEIESIFLMYRYISKSYKKLRKMQFNNFQFRDTLRNRKYINLDSSTFQNTCTCTCSCVRFQKAKILGLGLKYNWKILVLVLEYSTIIST